MVKVGLSLLFELCCVALDSFFKLLLGFLFMVSCWCLMLVLFSAYGLLHLEFAVCVI